jgi:hypothetical protein
MQFQRNGTDRTYVGGNVLTGRAIASRCGTHQDAVFIEDTDSQPVKFQLAAVDECIGTFQPILNAFVEAIKLCSSKTLSSDSIGISWRTWLNEASGAAPTRWVGNPA